MSATVKFEMQIIPDESPDVSYLEQDYSGCDDAAQMRAQDAARLAAFHAGDWHMVGVRAVAHVTVGHYKHSTEYTVSSAGLWGIESDSDAEYLKEVFAEECATLANDLREFGRLEVLS